MLNRRRGEIYTGFYSYYVGCLVNTVTLKMVIYICIGLTRTIHVAILKSIISRKQKAWSCAPSTTGAAYAASGAWRAQGRAPHALCLAGSPMGWPSYS